MPTYPYRYKKIEYGQIFNPLVLLPVKTAGGWQMLWFLIDSGADTTMLPAELANQLGLSFDADIKTKLYGIGRQAVYASPGKITLRVGEHEINVRSYFVHSWSSLLLLGRLDVFEKFSVTFSKDAKAVIFT